MGISNWFHLDFQEIERETDKAFCVILEDGEQIWLPKSQVSDSEAYQAGDKDGIISISEWFARKEGLI